MEKHTDPFSPDEILQRDTLDATMGFDRLTDGTKLGWLINMHEVYFFFF
jgi:hypothetical protein